MNKAQTVQLLKAVQELNAYLNDGLQGKLLPEDLLDSMQRVTVLVHYYAEFCYGFYLIHFFKNGLRMAIGQAATLTIAPI